jgi:CheY-like chemotaxis protein
MVTDTEVLEASILIVDDHQINVRLLERMLKNAGYFDVSGTSNPHDVLGLCRTLQPDLVLLDLFMPGIDGFHIMEKMKKGGRTSDPSVLVLTALNSPDVRSSTSSRR